MRQNILADQARQKKHHDAKHREAEEYCPGDLVTVRRKQLKKGACKKLSHRNIGPFQVVQKLGPNTYEVEDIPSRRTTTRWRVFNAHVSQLNRYYTRQGTEPESSGQSSGTESDSSLFSSSSQTSSMGDSSSDEESSSGKDSSSSWGPPRSSAASYSSSSSFSSPDEVGPALGLPQDSGPPSSAANANAPDALPVAAPSLGDVVWAYIPGHPLWPALITKDPFSLVHTKTKSVGRARIRLFHAEFYADNGARS